MFLFITHPASLLTANKRLCVTVFASLFGVSLSVSPSLFSPHSPPHNHYFVAPLPRSSSFSAISSSLWCLPVVCILQASVGWRHDSPQAAEHLPFFTQGGRGERLPPDSHQQSYHRQRGQSQGPRYSARISHKNQGRGGNSPHCQTINHTMCVLFILWNRHTKSGPNGNPTWIWTFSAVMFMKSTRSPNIQ